jgi:hypothetical protein
MKTGELQQNKSTEISVEGLSLMVPAAQISGRTVVVTGSWLKAAAVKDEDWQEGEVVPVTERFIAMIQKHTGLCADIFTFSQKFADPTPRFPFYYEWESIAAIPITSFSNWWNNGVSRDLRKDVRRASKRGVEVRRVVFSDDFVRAIMNIYDEKPIRQGRRFWHYKKGFDAVKQENASYLERSDFLGAFCGDEMIGFLKIVYVDHIARLMQIISKDSHRAKRPMNALIAKAVEICATKNCTHLTYGKYRYDHGADSVTAFKHRNGFKEILVPKYYVPLTTKGSMALRLRIHHGVKALVPDFLLRSLKRTRAVIYNKLLPLRVD